MGIQLRLQVGRQRGERELYRCQKTPSSVESFPFPWPPATTLNALTSVQEESRHAIARAVRAGSIEQLNEAVARAYGWPVDLAEDELLEKKIRQRRKELKQS